MPDIPSDKRIWSNVNEAIKDENLGSATASVIDGFSQLIMHGLGVTEDQARAHLAAICLSPAGRPIGSLDSILSGELNRLREGH